MDFKISQYNEDDFDMFAGLISRFQDYVSSVDSLKELRPFSSKKEARTYAKQALKDVNKMKGVVYIARYNDQVVGFIQGIIQRHQGSILHNLSHKKSIDGWIGLLFVEPKYRGQGTGKALLEAIESYFKKNKCKTIRLFVLQDNKLAVRIYQKLGYKIKDVEMVLKV